MSCVAHGDWLRLLPLIVPALAGMIALVIAAFRPDDRDWASLVVGAGGAVGGIAALVFSLKASAGHESLLCGAVTMDYYSIIFGAIVLAMLVGAVSLSIVGLHGTEYAHGEYWAMLAFSAVGMMLLAASTNLAITFIGIETMSIPIYALVGSDRRRSRPPEAALKYFLLGSFSSAFLLFGIAFIYGAARSLDYSAVVTAAGSVAGAQRAEFFLGLAMMIVGFGFKTSQAPFHMWTPDAYTGAPTSVTSFMASGVKAASFAAFIRLFAVALGPPSPVMPFWSNVLAVMAVATIVVGNLGAIAQKEVKRMLAYSGIAHAGYLLIGLRAASIYPGAAIPAMIYYLLVYTFTVLGAFAVLVVLERRADREITLDDLAGLSRRRPGYAAALALFMLSLAGVPPTGGFLAKLYVFSAAVKSGDDLLAVIGVVFSAISLFYYLRIIVLSWMADPRREDEDRPTTIAAKTVARTPTVVAVVATSAVLVLVFGMWPEPFVLTSRAAALSAMERGRITAENVQGSGAVATGAR